MTSAATYKYLTDCLSEAMLKAYPNFKPKDKPKFKGYGAYDKLPDAGKVAHLCLMFEQSIYRCERPVAYTDGEGNVFVFNGRIYDGVGNGLVFFRELVKRTMMALNVGNIYIANAPDKIAKSIMYGMESSDEFLFKPSRRYIAFTNGIFDLKDGKLKKFDSKYAPGIVLDIPYADPKTHYADCANRYGIGDNPCKRFDSFIKEVLPHNQVREAFQSFCGMMLVDRDELKVEYMACVYGPGSNGKSVLADVIKSVFGDRYYSNFTPKQLFKEGNASDFRMNELSGKLINIVGDLDKSDFSGGDFKRFISGEKIKARGVYARQFREIQPPIMLCCANEFPDSADDSYGHHRRLLPLASTTRIWTEEDKDPFLTAKLTTQDARIYVFSWIYDGYRRVMRNEGRIPLGEDVLNAQAYLRDRSNSMRRWWNDDSPYCKPESTDKGEWRRLKELHEEYCAYCDSIGDKKKFRDVELSKMLVSLGMTEDKGYKRKLNGTTQFLVARKDINE